MFEGASVQILVQHTHTYTNMSFPGVLTKCPNKSMNGRWFILDHSSRVQSVHQDRESGHQELEAAAHHAAHSITLHTTLHITPTVRKEVERAECMAVFNS